MVDEWDILTEEERSALIRTVSSDRTDSVWIGACVLTRSSVPVDLQQIILGSDFRISDGPEALIARMNPELFAASFRVFCGHPEPLWYYGKHHARHTPWRHIVETIAMNPDHFLFEEAWNELLFQPNDNLLAKMIAEIPIAHRPKILEIMLNVKAKTEADLLPKAWAVLLDRENDPHTHELWLEKMPDLAAVILDGIEDAKRWLTAENFRDCVKILKPDFSAIRILEIALEHNEVLGAGLSVFEAVIKAKPPLLHGTFNTLNEMLGDVSGYEKLKAFVESERSRVIDIKFKLKEIRDREDQKLEGWISP